MGAVRRGLPKKRRCRNCDEGGVPPPKPVTVKNATYEGESDRLWHHLLHVCGVLIETLYNYTVMDVPGEPLPQMRALHVRLGEIIQTREERLHASTNPTLGTTPGDTDHD